LVNKLVNIVKDGAAVVVARSVKPEETPVITQAAQKEKVAPVVTVKEVVVARKELDLAAAPATKFMFYGPGARKVALCGEFNGWSREATPMQLGSKGVWEAAVALSPGRYEYKYVVDGEWLPDPNAETTPNVYGSINSVIRVQV
jgi:1,4-alpha-glucan branching enzyme